MNSIVCAIKGHISKARLCYPAYLCARCGKVYVVEMSSEDTYIQMWYKEEGEEYHHIGISLYPHRQEIEYHLDGRLDRREKNVLLKGVE